MYMLIFANSGREASQGGSLGRNTSCSYETLGVVRSVGVTAVPGRVWTPVSARHSLLEAAVDWWCGLGGYQMKKSQAAAGSWGKWWRACGLSETKMDQQGDRCRPPSPDWRLRPRAEREKGPLPALTFRVNFADSTDLPFWSAEQCKQSRWYSRFTFLIVMPALGSATNVRSLGRGFPSHPLRE